MAQRPQGKRIELRGHFALPKNNRGEDMLIWIEWLKNDFLEKFKQFNSISQGADELKNMNTVKSVILDNMSLNQSHSNNIL